MFELMQGFFQAEGFMPHGMCYLWRPELLWLHVASDLFTGLAYWAIPPALLFLVVAARRELRAEGGPRRGLPYEWMFVAFGVFIVACGTTHFMAVWTVWEPRYWLSGGVKAMTAVASVATAVALPPLVPRALALLRSARQSEGRRLELERANTELALLNERLREADRLRSDLFANVSHELRTPLALILGPVETMLSGEGVPEEHRQRLETVQRNARSLLAQVDDLLDAARLEAGALETRWTRSDLAALARSVAAEFEPLAEERGVRLEVSGPAALPADMDEEKVRRIATNLLSNAFKFVPDRGRVRVDVGRSGDELRLAVADSGPGVPEHLREAVFERFRQGDGGATRRRGGTGLGLAIAREMAALHGGGITVEPDAELRGARFTVRLRGIAPEGTQGAGSAAPQGAALTGLAAPEDAGLPAFGGSEGADLDERAAPVSRGVPQPGGLPAPVSPKDGETADSTTPVAPGHREPPRGPVHAWAATPARTPAPGRPPRPDGRILVVEDNEEMARFLSEVLGSTWDVAVAHDGERALARAVADPPDLVVTDVMMPGMSGVDLVEALRRHERMNGVPILVLTARADGTLPAEMLRAGAQDYVVKPVPAEELRARAANLISAAVARRVLQEELATKEEDLGRLSRLTAERKRQLAAALREKDLLLRELAHRVKGSLQTLASLMNLQLRRLDPGPAREALEEARGRVAAMALLHERLTLTGDASVVDLGEYVHELVEGVFAARRPPDAEVGLELSVEEVLVPLDRAVPCGLLVHELVSNALRHAFRGPREAGMVRVGLARRGERVRLTITDDGEGEWEPGSHPGGGVRLVEALARQLGAEAHVERGEGTRWTVEVPLRGDEPTSV